MDKIAANNHFVVLRKEMKKSKAMVSGNLIRKIGKLKEELSKCSNEDEKNKLESKISAILEEVKLIKKLDCYEMSKEATKNPDPKYWQKIICDSKAKPQERLLARVVSKNNVQKQVTKFRSDHKDCDEWLEEYISFREQKKEILTKSSSQRNRTANKDTQLSKLDRKNRNSSHLHEKHNRFEKIKRHHSVRKDGRSEEPLGMGKFEPKKLLQSNESLHPSWESKRKEKELLRAALSGQLPTANKVSLS